jgi:hypothetical protein
MRIITGTYPSTNELATARERELAEKIMPDPILEELNRLAYGMPQSI